MRALQRCDQLCAQSTTLRFDSEIQNGFEFIKVARSGFPSLE
jgi:hypothetical protein